MKDNPTPENIGAFNKARDSVQEEAARLEGKSSSRICKTQLDAVSYLRDAGFKVSKSTFNRAVKSRQIPTTAEGGFEETALLGYAAVHLTPTGSLQDRALSDASANRLSADAQLKTWQAERVRLKLKKEQGLLMPRADHERDLGARALFFRHEARNFIHLHGAAIIHLVEGDEARLRDLVAWWTECTAVWMDAWNSEREFLVPDENMESAQNRNAPPNPLQPEDDEGDTV